MAFNNSYNCSNMHTMIFLIRCIQNYKFQTFLFKNVAFSELIIYNNIVFDLIHIVIDIVFNHMAPSPSGKARVCKTLIPSSNLGGASNLFFMKSYYLNNVPSILNGTRRAGVAKWQTQRT